MAYMHASMDRTLQDLKQEVHKDMTGSNQAKSGNEKSERLLLDEKSGQIIADYLECPELAAEIKRAVWQIGRSLRARDELKEEKADLDNATKRST